MKKKSVSLIMILSVMITAFAITFTSCKKKDSGNPDNGQGGSSQLSDADSLKLLMYNIMEKSFVNGGRDVSYDLPLYYWYDQVKNVDPLSAAFPDAKSLLTYMKTFAKDGNGQPFDHYSFLDNGEINDEVQQGVAGDLGMEISFAYDANKNIILVVIYTDKNSPSGKAGVQRGWVISSINGQSTTYDGPNGTNVQRIVQAVYYDDQATFTFKKPDASTATMTLAKAQYQINPVLFDSVYTIAGKKVGYFVFYTFSNITNDDVSTLTKQELDRVFNKFSSENISSLIVDLRYNSGGSNTTSEYLDDLIAPSSLSGKVMYQFDYNGKLNAQKSNIGLDDKVLFKGGGSLNLQNVFFIGSRNTASASELTYNNLKPYMNVQLVGDTTYGKPVGFIARHISITKNGVVRDLADLYPISFSTKNANNDGGYYHGLIPDELANDYIGTPWGQPGDENLEKIFSYISSGSYGRTMPVSERVRKNPDLKVSFKKAVHSLRFNGMISERLTNSVKKLEK